MRVIAGTNVINDCKYLGISTSLTLWYNRVSEYRRSRIMEFKPSLKRPTAYVGVLREEDVPDLMHQLYEPVYGARTEQYPWPFLWGTHLTNLVLRAAARGFSVSMVH